MIFSGKVKLEQVRELSPRALAHLGDAVFELYEREKELKKSETTKKIHQTVVSRVNASAQAQLLFGILDKLTEKEADIVRRARNLKVTNYKKTDQASYRQATAFEALLGYLYLTDFERLKEILLFTDELG